MLSNVALHLPGERRIARFARSYIDSPAGDLWRYVTTTNGVIKMPSEQPLPKERFVAKSGLGVGNHRYELYAHAWEHTKTAIDRGFYLEAITLLESLLSDRMESRASFLTGANKGFKNLGSLVGIFRDHESVAGSRRGQIRKLAWRP